MFTDSIEWKKNKARNILIDSGWIEKYYYVIKVLKSCNYNNIKNTMSIINTRKWGRNVLTEYFEIIKEKHKHKSYYSCLLEEHSIYYEQFRKISDEVLSAFLDEVTNSGKEVDFKIN